MLHRFEDAATGARGHSAAALASQLELLRRQRYRFVSIADLMRELAAGRRPKLGTIVFTVDDGYCDFADVAAPIFMSYDCPVTAFLVTGVIDRGGWYWWDQVEFVLTQTARHGVTLELGGLLHLAWRNEVERVSCAETLCTVLKRVPEGQRVAALEHLGALLEVTVPTRPPDQFAPMTWRQVRRCADGGATFGPHTVTHPILSRTGDAQAAFEIRESWNRLRAETAACVPVFCYPQGDPQSFGGRERDLVRDLGLLGAVSTAPGYPTRATFSHPERRFAVPRFPFPDDRFPLVQIVTGLERWKASVRSIGKTSPRV